MEYARRLRNAKIIGTPVLKAAEEIPQLRIRERLLRETGEAPLPVEEEESSHGGGHAAPPAVHGKPSGHGESSGHPAAAGHSGH